MTGETEVTPKTRRSSRTARRALLGGDVQVAVVRPEAAGESRALELLEDVALQGVLELTSHRRRLEGKLPYRTRMVVAKGQC